MHCIKDPVGARYLAQSLHVDCGDQGTMGTEESHCTTHTLTVSKEQAHTGFGAAGLLLLFYKQNRCRRVLTRRRRCTLTTASTKSPVFFSCPGINAPSYRLPTGLDRSHIHTHPCCRGCAEILVCEAVSPDVQSWFSLLSRRR